MVQKLNLGCGSDIRKGWINLDSINLQGVDVVHDIEKLPLPFKNEEFDEILCLDILEHVEYVSVLEDLHRILKKGGKIKIQVPHFTSRNNYIDPTHKKRFSIKTFEFFVEDSKHGRDYYFHFHFNKIINQKITFEKGILFFNHLIEPLINSSNKMQILYEKTFLSRIFPAMDIEVELIK
ncbi:MAG: methyltransferase domain-containing protein [Candidatus Nanoarchaeia archaeon]|nr:methyltransferase domain-containing protein [Candidatus Nanoarchaeia archaeon]